LSIRERELVTLIGANGAGKTTTLKALAGMIPPAAGEIRYLGRPVTGKPACGLGLEGLVLVTEGRQVCCKLTVEENLE
ncbi:ATP-binding cassette domain-containing protein, partial [Pelomicrobium sp. G1]|uniref:ATP-binding cassette domain-containing protein n=1 Tax=Pelomicrobium sp. G1 TaxID=3452920 RepID=UPI003F766907